MEIPNLSPSQPSPIAKSQSSTYSLPIVIGIIVLSLITGYVLSRGVGSSTNSSAVNSKTTNKMAESTDNVTSTEQLQVGKVYGNLEKNFKDIATGTIEKGNINGEGTHILNRAGGASQRASLTSSAVDLDLFVGKKVEVKGETNASNKTSWLLDVGSIKILE